MFTATMVDSLREPFERWLSEQMLSLERVPAAPPDHFIVVPDPSIYSRETTEWRRSFYKGASE